MTANEHGSPGNEVNRKVNSMSDRKLGTSTSLFRAINPAEHFELMVRYGLAYVEIATNCIEFLEDNEQFADFKAEIANAKLLVNSIHVPFSGRLDISSPDADARHAALDKAVLCLDRLAELAGRCIVIHPSSEPITDEERPDRISNCVESLKKLCPRAEASGALVAVENLPRTCLGRDSAELCEIVDRVGSSACGVCLDTNHLFRETLVEATRRFGVRIQTLHISDHDGMDERHWMPGAGVIAWGRWYEALCAAGYHGPLIYEVINLPAGASECIRQVRKNAEEMFGLE